MQKSYRLRTEVGVDKEIRLNIDQDFDYLEVLSLKLRQEDLYDRFCADYGVIAGRVIVNGGYGVPNVNISVFVPITTEDEANPIISTLYPYKTPNEKNEDGYRYNLLPYERQYNGHTPTGTFPTKDDVLKRKEVLEVYEKYYKYTVKTNESGDFMIVGVPLGVQKVVMDCDLSNIGEFSLRPYDLIRMGLAVESQFNGSLFKSSEDLNSLPQIVNSVVDVDVTPFWGENDLCNVGITRIDFDLREQGIEITPNAIFMGSIMSTSEEDFLKSNCKLKKDMGELCALTTGPGQILAIRQKSELDSEGLPVLEEYKFSNGGYVIDENGTWMVDVPMNMDNIVTNEFGEQVISKDPVVGIPSTAKYRFKIKWLNEAGLGKDIQRANYLVPNIRENGWSGDTSNDRPENDVINKSYAFSLDWNDYYDLSAAVNCEDTFYKFKYNKVYTIASHIDRFKWGNSRRKHIGIKDITSRDCVTENNRYPTNDAVKKTTASMFLFDLLILIITPIILALIPILHAIGLLYAVVRLIVNIVFFVINIIIYPICIIVALFPGGKKPSDCQLFPDNGLLPPFGDLVNISLPMLSYPDCDRCNCKTDTVEVSSDELDDAAATLAELSSGVIVNVTQHGYYEPIDNASCCNNDDEKSTYLKYIVSGYDDNILDGFGGLDAEKKWRTRFFKSPVHPTWNDCDPDEDLLDEAKKRLSPNVTLAQSMNLMNRKQMYNGVNRSTAIQTTLVNDQLPGPSSDSFTDNALIIFCDWGTNFEPGTLLSFNDLNEIADANTIRYEENNEFGNKSITGTCSNWSSDNLVGVDVTYQKTDGTEDTATVYIYNPFEKRAYNFKSGVEYFQVITGTTLGNVQQLNGTSNSNLFNYHIFNKKSYYDCDPGPNLDDLTSYVKPIEYYQNYESLSVLILNRGVDVWTPKQKIKYDLSKIFGQTSFNGSRVVEGEYYMNVPTQRNNNTQSFNAPGLGSNKINDHRYDEFTPNPHYERNGGTNNMYFFSNNNDGVSEGGTISGLFHKPFSGFKPNSSEWIPFDTFCFNKYSSIDGQIEDLIDQAYGFDIDTFSPKDDNAIDNPDNGDTQYNTSNPQIRIDGCGYQYTNDVGNNRKVQGGEEVTTVSALYIPKNFSDLDDDQTPRTNMSNHEKLIFRSDRLPSSDSYEFADYDIDNGVREVCSRYVLHLNDAFVIYKISDDGIISATAAGEGQETASYDASGDALDLFEDNERISIVSNTFTCEGMVPMPCYSGTGEDFGVEDPCTITESNIPVISAALDWLTNIDGRVNNGCYTFVRSPLILTIPADIYFFFEWRMRIKLMYDICQGVISQEFYNNWINGNLYMPAFQKKNFFDDDNNLESYRYCGDPTQDENKRYQGPIYFNTETNSFFYRSTPYGNGTFYGQVPERNYIARNRKNIWFPTTIMDLGPRDEYAKEISLTPDFEGYVMDKLESTSYKDISDIVVIFIISRLSNASFLETILGYGDGATNGLFGRELGVFNPFDGRVDGDYAQLVSINSEFGVVPYIEGNYADSIYFGKNEGLVGALLDSVGLSTSFVGIWFDSDTIDRRLLTPGIQTIGTQPENNGINYLFEDTQTVPYYMWYIDPNGTVFTDLDFLGSGNPNTVFGSQLNTWKTDTIYSTKYQGDDFAEDTITYMRPDAGYGLGHIYNKDTVDEEKLDYPQFNPNQNNFKVGAPFHFYFGLRIGKTALTRFITKYIGLEQVSDE